MRRPVGVVLIALYHFLLALGGTLAFTIPQALRHGLLEHLGGGAQASTNALLIATFLGFVVGAVGSAVVGYGVWTLRQWGRLLSIAFAGVALLSAVGRLFSRDTDLVWVWGAYDLLRCAVSLLIIWYLMRPEVRSLFRRDRVAITP